ncbi:MAG: RNA-binding S4 domain-containing protein [Prevotellaceae bacterium]|jgi:ribosome-associated protein|nr:RNA-binding S4 domain-containing protein [Prevotellaceae bacterium]
MIEFEISKGDYIELMQLLKAVKLAYSGGEAKLVIEDGLVKLNGQTEWRKRAKIRSGDIVEVMGQKIAVQ